MKSDNEISVRALKMLFRISGLRQGYVAKKLCYSEQYLSYILNGKRKSKKAKQRIYDFLWKHHSECGIKTDHIHCERWNSRLGYIIHPDEKLCTKCASNRKGFKTLSDIKPIIL